MNMKDTTAIIIPIDQIEKIKLQAKKTSSALTAVLIVGLAIGVACAILGLTWFVFGPGT